MASHSTQVREVESDSTPEPLCRFCAVIPQQAREARELIVGKGCTACVHRALQVKQTLLKELIL